jgi:hypothetical protein
MCGADVESLAEERGGEEGCSCRVRLSEENVPDAWHFRYESRAVRVRD